MSWNKKYEYFLNNVRNCKANCLQVPAQKDELEENTKMYSSEWNMIQKEEEEDQQQKYNRRINRRYFNRISLTVKWGGYQ